MVHNMLTPTRVTIVGFGEQFCHNYCLQLELHSLSHVLLLKLHATHHRKHFFNPNIQYWEYLVIVCLVSHFSKALPTPLHSHAW